MLDQHELYPAGPSQALTVDPAGGSTRTKDRHNKAETRLRGLGRVHPD